jgi:ATP-dependent Clp protease ATP-binding subunit ClpA
MTSNVGARDLARRTVGFAGGSGTSEAEREYTRMFSPEFRNRLDGRIDYAPLSQATMVHIVKKFLGELGLQLSEKGVTLKLTDAASDYLAKKGYDPDMGARPLGRVIHDELKKPIGEELLFGKLEKGGSVDIDVVEGKLSFLFHAAVKQLPLPVSN